MTSINLEAGIASHKAATALAAVALYVLYSLAIYPFFICPTRHLPGTYISKVTVLLERCLSYRHEQLYYVRQLHSKYGPVVRVSPSSVSVCSAGALATIYGARATFPKPPDAVIFENYGRPNAFSSVAKEDHKRRRGRYSSVYSKSAVSQGEVYDAVAKRTAEVLSLFKTAAETGDSIDIFRTFHLYALDNASVAAYGTSVNTLKGQNRDVSNHLRDLIAGIFPLFSFPLLTFLWTLPVIGKLTAPSAVTACVDSYDNTANTTLQHFHKSNDIADPEVPKSVLARLKQHKDFGTPDLTDLDVASELHDHFFAGGDTTSAALTYIFYHLSLPENRRYLDRLVAELQSVNFNEAGFPNNHADIDSLPWLDCVVKEVLRLETPTGGHLARRVPKGGFVVEGFHIPEYIEIGVAPYILMLTDPAFPDSETFKPERWLTEDEEELNRMKLAWIPFGHGTRVCVGQHLSMVEIKLMTATVFRQLLPKMDSAYDLKGMEAVHTAVIAPRGGVCFMNFESGEG